LIFCSSACFGIHHRSNKTSEQKKAEKAVYDKAYRQENLAVITAKKAAYHKATYDPAEARIKRKERMPRHVQYCRSPAYRAYKQHYDCVYRAKRQFGVFWESALILHQLETEINERSDFTDRAIQKNTLNKRQTRKREYESSINS
jgi:hypothetical protein